MNDDLKHYRAPRSGWKIVLAIIFFILAYGYAGQDSYEQAVEARMGYPLGCGQWVAQRGPNENWRTYQVCAEQKGLHAR